MGLRFWNVVTLLEEVVIYWQLAVVLAGATEAAMFWQQLVLVLEYGLDCFPWLQTAVMWEMQMLQVCVQVCCVMLKLYRRVVQVVVFGRPDLCAASKAGTALQQVALWSLFQLMWLTGRSPSSFLGRRFLLAVLKGYRTYHKKNCSA